MCEEEQEQVIVDSNFDEPYPPELLTYFPAWMDWIELRVLGGTEVGWIEWCKERNL